MATDTSKYSPSFAKGKSNYSSGKYVGSSSTGKSSKKKNRSSEEDQNKTLYSYAEYSSRMQNEYNSKAQEINDRLKGATDKYNSYAKNYKPEWGKKMSDVYDERIDDIHEVNSLYDDISKYRSYIGDKDADTALKALDVARNGYYDRLNASRLFEKYGSEDEYNRDRVGWLQGTGKDNTTADRIKGRQEYYQSNKTKLDEINNKLSNISKDMTADEYNDLKKQRDALELDNRRYEREQKTVDDYYGMYADDKKVGPYNPYAYGRQSRQELEQADARYSEDSKRYLDAIGRNIGFDNDTNEYIMSDGKRVKAPENVSVPDKLGLFLQSKGNTKDITDAYASLEYAGNDNDNTWASVIREGDGKYWDQLTDTEIGIYYSIYDQQGQEAAYKFLSDMETELGRRNLQSRSDDYSSDEYNRLQKLAMRIATHPATVVGGAIAFADDAYRLATGQELDPYNARNNLLNYASMVKSNRAEEINNSKWGKYKIPGTDFGMGDAYLALSSGIDSLVGAGLFGGAYNVIMGMGAAASTAKDLYEQGASNKQIAIGSITAGIAEGLFEKYSIENLINMGDSKTIKDVVKNIAKQAGIEASEEMATEVANTITNALTMRSQSDWAKLEAEGGAKEAILGTVKNVINAGLGGAISGGAMGGSASAFNNVLYNADSTSRGKALAESGMGNVYAEYAEKNNVAPDRLEAVNKLLNRSVDNSVEENVDNSEEQTQEQTQGKPKRKDFRNLGKLADEVDTGIKENITKSLIRDYLTNQGADASQGMIDDVYKSMQNNAEVQFGKNKKAIQIAKQIKEYEGLDDIIKAKSDEKRAGLVDEYVSDKIKEAVTRDQEASIPDTGADIVSGSGDTIVMSTGEIADIKSVESAGDGKLQFLMSNGDTVASDDIQYGNIDEARIYGTVAELGVNETIANNIMDDFRASDMDSRDFAVQMMRAYNYGATGQQARLNDLKIGNDIKNVLYVTGRDSAIAQAEAKTAEAKQRKVARRESNGLIYENEIDTENLSKRQKATIHIAEFISQNSALNVHMFESYKKDGSRRRYINIGGVEQASLANGWYRQGTNDIYIDVNAGNDYSGIGAFTLAHEMSHYIRDWNAVSWKNLADAVVEEIDAQAKADSKKNDFETLVAKKYNRYKSNRDAEIENGIEDGSYAGKTDDELAEMAYEDVICDSVASLMVDKETFTMFADKLKEKDASLWEKLKSIIKDFLDKVEGWIKDFNGGEIQLADDEAGRAIQNAAEDIRNKIRELYIDAFMGADENFNMASVEDSEVVQAFGDDLGEVSVNDEGDIETVSNEDGSVIVCSERTWTDSGRDTLEKTLRDNGYSEDEISNAVGFMDDIVKFLHGIADAGNTRLANSLQTDITVDVKNGRAILHTLTTNGEYPVNFDLSTICKKRVAYQRVLNNLLKNGIFSSLMFDSYAIADVNKILRENGYETACPACFVEARRMQIQKWAETFVSEWNENVEARFPNAGYFNFASGQMNFSNEEIENLESELAKSGKKNSKGNLNLGKGSVATKMGRLLDKVPSLGKKLTVNDMLLPEGIKALRTLDSNMFSLIKQRYGAASPKITQEFEAYSSDAALMTFKYLKDIDGNSVKGNQTYIRAAAKELGLKQNDKRVQNLALRNYLYDIGGARSQSFSDFMIENVLDKLQLIADIAARRFPMHEYTKEIASARIFGMTGLKENMSIIHHIDPALGSDYAGLHLNEDGTYGLQADDYENYVRTGMKSQIQSAGFKDAVALMLDPRYTKNVGTIAIGFSDNHILHMLDNKFIRMVIPYHKSGLPPVFAEMTNISYASDYTDFQNTTVKQFYDMNGMMVSAFDGVEEPKYDASFLFNKALKETGDARQAADEYIKWCAERHPVYNKSTGKDKKQIGWAVYKPKFSGGTIAGKTYHDFTTHENYYKLLEDFNVYDTLKEQPAEQMDVQMNFPSKDNALSGKALEDYRKALENTGMFSAKEIEKYAGIAQMSVEDLIEKELASMKVRTDIEDEKFDETMKQINKNLQEKHLRSAEKSPNQNVLNSERDSDIRYSERETKESADLTDKVLFGTQYSSAGMMETGLGLAYKMIHQQFAVELDDKVAAVHMENHDVKVYAGEREGNALTFDIKKHADGLMYAHFSPVCHNFSRAKHGGKETALDIASARKVAKDIEDTMLPVYTVENAPAYLNSKSAGIIHDKLRELGYKMRPMIYNAADYGSATSRERYVLVAVRGDLELPDMPIKQNRTNSWDKATAPYWDGLKNAKARNGKAVADFYYDALLNTKKLQKYMNADGTMSIDKPLLLLTTTSGHELTFAEYGKLCPTLTTNCGEAKLILPGDHISFDKPNDNIKQVTPEFMGAIMGLPGGKDGFKYGKAATRAFTIIGNGIPTDLTRAVIGGALESVYRQTHDGKNLYSERVSNQELADRDDTGIYIKNTKNANYIGMILNGTKTEETRSRRTLDAFIGKKFYVTDGNKVYGSIVLGEPHKYTAEEFHKKENQKKHRVPKGDTYDIKPGGIKWAYPIESYERFDKPQKLSESKEYKNSFQARQVLYSERVTDESTLDMLNKQVRMGAYDPVKNPDGGYYVTYKSMSFWGYDENGNALLRSPMAESVNGELSPYYVVDKDGNPNWYKSTEILDEATGIPKELILKIGKGETENFPKSDLKRYGSDYYVLAYKYPNLIKDDWSNCYFPLIKKVEDGVKKNGEIKYKDSPVPARYAPYEHSSNLMLNDQFDSAWRRGNLVTVKMYVPRSEDNGSHHTKYAKDPTGWTPWHSGIVAGNIRKQKPEFDRQVYLSRYAAPVEIVKDSDVAQAYKEYVSGTDIKVPDNVVSPSLLKELRKAGVPIKETGKIKFQAQNDGGMRYSDRENAGYHAGDLGKAEYLRQQGYGRGTGHFGTGTYFVGDKDKVEKDSYYGKRPQHAVNFDNYDLFKPRNTRDGYKLHDALKVIDGGVRRDFLTKVIRGDFRYFNLTDKFDIYDRYQSEIDDWDEAQIAGHKEILDKLNVEYQSFDEFVDDANPSYDMPADQEYALADYEDYLDRIVETELDAVNDDYSLLRDAKFDLEMSLGSFGGKVDKALKRVVEYSESTPRDSKSDSYATVFMKAMGYDGIDVRGMEGLDNTTYGSVIYDVNPDSVLYSERDPDFMPERSMLAQALESYVKNDKEKRILEEYKKKIQYINNEEFDLNATKMEIKELYNKPGKRDTEKIKELKFKAKRHENRINFYDKKLLKLESTKFIRDLLDREKAKTLERADKNAQKYVRDYLRRYETRQNKALLKANIKKIVKELQQRELNPKKNKYVPVRLIKPVSDLLASLNMDSGRSVNITAHLKELKEQYQQISKDPEYAVNYDPFVEEMISNLIEKIGNKSIYSMNMKQLQATNDTLSALLTTIREAVKAHNINTNKDIYGISNEMKKETSEAGKVPRGNLARYIFTSLRPETMFNQFGGFKKDSMWSKVFEMLNKGQLNQMRIEMESNMIFRRVFENQKYVRSLSKDMIDVGLKDENGESVLITRGMMLTIYKHLMNEDNARHIMVGGLTVPDIKKYYAGSGDAYGRGMKRIHGIGNMGLSEINQNIKEAAELKKEYLEDKNYDEADEMQRRVEELMQAKEEMMQTGYNILSGIKEKIVANITDNDLEFLAATSEYFDNYSKKELNKVTMEMYGFKKANVKNYLPIHTDPNFRNASFEQITKDFNLENSGFMKDRINGTNPILLEDMAELINCQITKTARYCGLTLPIKDFGKIYSNRDIKFASSLQYTFAKTFESPGKKYIENLLSDLVGSRNGESTFFDRARGFMAGATLSINPRVALAQAASYPTAAAELGVSALAKASGHFLTKNDYDLIAMYTPLVYNRSKGAYTELADIKAMSQTQNRVMKKLNWLMGWIEAIDKKTVGVLWYASQEYVKNNSNLAPGTSEYYMAVAEKFNKVVERTQPNYATLQRPDILRNPNAVVKQLTMFMTQRLQNANIVYDATARYAKYSKDYRKGINEVTKQDVSEARGAVVRAVGSQLVAASMIVGIKFGVDLLLHSMNAYRDKDKELTEDSIKMSLIDNMLESLVSNILGGSELYTVLDSVITGNKYYGVSLNGVGAYADAITNFVELSQASRDAYGEYKQGTLGDDDYTISNVKRLANELAKSVCTLMGIPLGNVEKIVNGIMYHVEDYQNGEFGSYEAGVYRNAQQDMTRVFKAYMNHDDAMKEKLMAKYGTEKKYNLEVRKALKANDPRIVEAARARANGDLEEYMRLAKEIKAEGNFSQDDIVRAINSAVSDMSIGTGNSDKPEKHVGIYTTSDFDYAIQNNDTDLIEEIKADVVETKVANGNTEDGAEKSANSAIYSAIKSSFDEGNISEAQAKEALIKFDGKDAEYASKKIEVWKFNNENPDYDFTDSQIQHYNAEAKPAGISLDVYADYSKKLKDCTGFDKDGDGKTDAYSVQNQVIKMIDSLPLSSSQKTALFLTKYKQTALKRCPW